MHAEYISKLHNNMFLTNFTYVTYLQFIEKIQHKKILKAVEDNNG